MTDAPFSLTATQAIAAMGDGRLTSVALVESCLQRIAATDAGIGAWAHLDPAAALAQARAADAIRAAGLPVGMLHGVPVGLKDIIDTADMPTACGTPALAGRQPEIDAVLVGRLREAGAVIMGKTVTTELAFMQPSATRNPHNPAHSPGGSSSGSAAAVAALHVPLAVGSQTNGSVVRPASFCGVFGFKPTRGTIGRSGVLQTSVSLDQIGGFARTLADVALLTDAMQGHDPADSASHARPRAALLPAARMKRDAPPRLLWIEMPYHDRLTAAARDGLDAVLDELGAVVTRVPASATMAELVSAQAVIHEYELARHQIALLNTHGELLSPTVRAALVRGRTLADSAHADALHLKARAEDAFADVFGEYDAIIAPSAAGEAPLIGPEFGTGDPIFCTIWTLLGLPAINVPLLVGETGLPIGVQLIGAPERDDRLLPVARWLQHTLTDAVAGM